MDASRTQVLLGLLLLASCNPPTDGPGTPDVASPPDTAAPATPTPPNILLLFSDQHRGDAIGAAGHPVVLTPRLDALADEGVLFRQMYTNAPVCRPARASLMSGLYPHQNGVTTNTERADETGPSHVRRIRDEAGYRTALIGKAHLYIGTAHTEKYRHILDSWGFVDSIELVGPTEQTWRETPYSDYLEARTGPDEGSRYQRYVDYVENYDWGAPPPDAEPWKLRVEDHVDVYTGRVAAQWIREHDPAQPFYLQVNFPGPHKPFDATQAYRDLYDPNDPTMPDAITDFPEAPVAPLVQQLLDEKGLEWEDEARRQLAVDYYAKVTLVDEAIGTVIDALRVAGTLDNTWIVYSSDHGELLADHGLTGKILFFHGSWNVPLIIRPPGGTAPWTSDALVDTVDLTASLLEMAGLTAETDAPGRSQVARVAAGPDAPDAHLGKPKLIAENMGASAIRSQEWMLTYDQEEGVPVELYDLLADPHETENLIDTPGYEPKIIALTESLLGIRSDHPAPEGDSR